MSYTNLTPGLTFPPDPRMYHVAPARPDKRPLLSVLPAPPPSLRLRDQHQTPSVPWNTTPGPLPLPLPLSLSLSLSLPHTRVQGEPVSLAQVDRLDLQYTYKEGAMYYFMDSATYEEVSIDEKVVGEKSGFFLEGMELSVSDTR